MASWTTLKQPTGRLVAIVAAGGTVAAATGTLYAKSRCQEPIDAGDAQDYRIEVHLMDKIQRKPYLEGSSRQNIPSTLRVLAIDLPEMRTNAFSGHCRLAHDKIFVDDIAPRTIVPRVSPANEEESEEQKNESKSKTNNQQSKLKVAQKSLLKSLVQCSSPQSQQKFGVELLEASVADLNRYGLRKTHQVGSFKYDPGKYYNGKGRSTYTGQQKVEVVERDRDDEELEEADNLERSIDDHRITDEDEIEAPWNQYAWKEELFLRIHGKVGFGAPLEKSPRLQRYLLGSAYKHTVPSSQRMWDWLLPSFLRRNATGKDGPQHTECWASNKPHAVIANGAALQRVPSSLRLMQKYCKDANVPLYVIHDPRVWGGNTHESLSEALKEMRQEIKIRVVRQALQQHGSSAFARGRIVGQLERETKWMAKDRTRRVRNFFSTDRRHRSEETPQDWSELDSAGLEKKLVRRGVIKHEMTGDNEIKRVYSDGMAELNRQVQEDEAKKVFKDEIDEVHPESLNDDDKQIAE